MICYMDAATLLVTFYGTFATTNEPYLQIIVLK